jgi:hypothetical protein
VNHARYLRGRYPLPPRDDGEVLRFIDVNKDQQRADVDVAGININAFPAKVFPALWHFSHWTTDVIFFA